MACSDIIWTNTCTYVFFNIFLRAHKAACRNSTAAKREGTRPVFVAYYMPINIQRRKKYERQKKGIRTVYLYEKFSKRGGHLELMYIKFPFFYIHFYANRWKKFPRQGYRGYEEFCMREGIETKLFQAPPSGEQKKRTLDIQKYSGIMKKKSSKISLKIIKIRFWKNWLIITLNESRKFWNLTFYFAKSKDKKNYSKSVDSILM